MDRDLQRLLGLAKTAIERRDSPLWGSDPGRACEAVWSELERLLSERDVIPLPSPKKVRDDVRKAATAHLKSRLPDVVSDLLEELG